MICTGPRACGIELARPLIKMGIIRYAVVPATAMDGQTNPQKVTNKKGCYTLVISLRKSQWLQIGKLGAARFPRGTYSYTGSAMGGLGARISRHLTKRNKKIHWHIDYLLRAPETRVTKVLIYPATRKECLQNQRIAALPNAKVIMKGFGASDCTSGCASHLIFLASKRPIGTKKLLDSSDIDAKEGILWKQ